MKKRPIVYQRNICGYHLLAQFKDGKLYTLDKDFNFVSFDIDIKDKALFSSLRLLNNSKYIKHQSIDKKKGMAVYRTRYGLSYTNTNEK
jgi:hypothetical protein